MNFVGHRQLAHRQLHSPVAAIGAMLPDLWRMADRRVRPRRDVLRQPPPTSSTDNLLGALELGVFHHLWTDRWFHKSPLFLEGERAMAQAFAAAGARAPKIGLFAHVSWEMCLDGAAVRLDTIDVEIAALKSGLTALQKAIGPQGIHPLDRLVERHHFAHKPTTQVERGQFGQRLARILDELVNGQWIEGYQDPTGLSVRLAGVRTRVGLPRPDSDEMLRWQEAFLIVQPQADEAQRDLRSSAPYPASSPDDGTSG